MKKRIAWLSTGGTIACEDSGNGLTPVQSSEILLSMLKEIPQVYDLCEVDAFSLCCLDSTDIQPSDWVTIADSIDKYITGYDGIVVTHGTDSMAYTASMMHFMLKNPPIPIVFTGSQLPFFSESSDAPENLYNAFLTACSDMIHDVCIVFEKRIIPAQTSYKAYSKNKIGFISRGGYYGHIANGTIIPELPSPMRTPYSFSDKICEDVLVIKAVPNINRSILDYAKSAGYKGIIIEAYGMGGIPSVRQDFLDGVGELCQSGVAIEIVSQCMFDGVNMHVYKVGLEAQKAGIKNSGMLTTESALAKMMWELGNK